MQQSLGHRAEKFVAKGLEASGWSVVARNFRRRSCEIDLVAKKAETLIFVEVKARSTNTLPSDLDSLIPPKKRRALQLGAQHFQITYCLAAETMRFDLALVLRNPRDNSLSLAYYPGFMN